MPEQPEFAGPVASAGEASGTGWRLSDESATPKLLVYESFEPGDGVAQSTGTGFGTSVRRPGDALVCGVRPGEWLILGPPPSESAAGDGGSATVPDAPGFAGGVQVDLTHGLAMFRLTGPAAPDLLAAVCSIDTAEAMMPDGAVCGASVARVSCTLVRDDSAGERSYLILAPRSYGRYLFEALADAGGSHT